MWSMQGLQLEQLHRLDVLKCQLTMAELLPVDAHLEGRKTCSELWSNALNLCWRNPSR